MKKDYGPYSMSGKLMRVPATRHCGTSLCLGCVFESSPKCDERRCRYVVPGRSDDDGSRFVDYILIDPADRPVYDLAAVKYKLTGDFEDWREFLNRQSLKGRST